MPLVARAMSPISSSPGLLDRGRVGDDGAGQVAARDRVERALQGGRVLALERAQAVEHLRGGAADAAADEEDDGGGEQRGQQAGEDARRSARRRRRTWRRRCRRPGARARRRRSSPAPSAGSGRTCRRARSAASAATWSPRAIAGKSLSLTEASCLRSASVAPAASLVDDRVVQRLDGRAGLLGGVDARLPLALVARLAGRDVERLRGLLLARARRPGWRRPRRPTFHAIARS